MRFPVPNRTNQLRHHVYNVENVVVRRVFPVDADLVRTQLTPPLQVCSEICMKGFNRCGHRYPLRLISSAQGSHPTAGRMLSQMRHLWSLRPFQGGAIAPATGQKFTAGTRLMTRTFSLHQCREAGAADRSFARLAAARKCLRPFNSTQLSMPPFGRLGNTSPGFAAAISFELEALKIGF
jgi:hypothetical protein